MMNYEIFKEVVKEKFMDYMPEKFKGMELVVEPVEKVNVTLDGIILREEGRNDLEKAAVTVAEGIKDYSTGKRGR